MTVRTTVAATAVESQLTKHRLYYSGTTREGKDMSDEVGEVVEKMYEKLVHTEKRMSQFIYLRTAIYVGTHVLSIVFHSNPTEPVMHFPACGCCGGWIGWDGKWKRSPTSPVYCFEWLSMGF